MAMAWSRRVLSTTIPPPDKVFTKNFMKEFLEQLKKENPQSGFLNTFIPKYLASIDNHQQPKTTVVSKEIDFTQVKNFIIDEKAKERSHNQRRQKAAG